MFRTAETNQTIPMRWNAARDLGVTYEGKVYRARPQVNWPLLILCQSLLALPLLLTWLALPWRLKRRLRMAGAAV